MDSSSTMPIPTAACDTNTTWLFLGQGCSNLLPFRCFQLLHWTLFCTNLQEIKTSALSCRIPFESIQIQGSDFLNCVILPEKLLDSDPKKKNVFSTMQCHVSLFINHFLILINTKSSVRTADNFHSSGTDVTQMMKGLSSGNT